ncbi:CrcB-like protein [Caenispirillum salinarum AK4]|uniref:Fluoride-specific ion channel FluC n=1 Tax=Caenispirillum salinarum AK4 TaxID=1238182 RepID=K9GWZ9_9PROT|nr:fluoride efflux transporter CrcB [Caenispirillum salinarum]EKV29279.1 CrcB-like protein [Caenispirillum salinarum AK4]
MSLKMLLAVAAGGALGSVGRYATGVLMGRLLGMGFPWGTLTVNIVGSFLMGALIEWAALRGVMSQEARAFVFIGVLGGFTTFSSFSLDVAALVERGALAPAAAYVTATIIVGVAALFIGLYTARTLLT